MALVNGPRWVDPDFPKSRNFFFIARPPSRIMTNPKRRVGSFFEHMNLEPQLGPVTFRNPKIVFFNEYSLWIFSEWLNPFFAFLQISWFSEYKNRFLKSIGVIVWVLILICFTDFYGFIDFQRLPLKFQKTNWGRANAAFDTQRFRAPIYVRH